MAREPKHQDKMFTALAAFRTLVEHWDLYDDEKRKEIVKNGAWAMNELMFLRNLVRDASALEEPVNEVIRFHLDDDGEAS